MSWTVSARKTLFEAVALRRRSRSWVPLKQAEEGGVGEVLKGFRARGTRGLGLVTVVSNLQLCSLLFSLMITFKMTPRSLRKTFLGYKQARGFLKDLHITGAEKEFPVMSPLKEML